MKTLLVFLIMSLATVALGQASSASKEEDLSSAEQLRAFGYDPAKVYEFVAQLQKAVASNNKQAVSSLVGFPLDVIVGNHKHKVRSKASFLSQYNEIFSPSVRAALAAQQPDHVFIKSTAFMIGRGELWFNETSDNHFRVIEVQPDTRF